MENKGLIFIPDISGFTQFVNKVDIIHSRLIIQELLEIIANSNQIGLTISEIEGDAILFYKYGESPDLEALYRQVEKMFCEFHRSLLSYDISRYCYCDACSSAVGLTLKVITHYGEFMNYQVKDFKKLIGKDIIVAHQLLKNDIDQHEYWLITNNLKSHSTHDTLSDNIHWNQSIKHTESGDILYQYMPLSALKDKVQSPENLVSDLPHKVKMVSNTKEYDTDIITLFRSAGMFEYRNRWQEGVKAVEELHHYLPRVGMKCRYKLEGGEEVICSSNYSFHPERISFTENNEDQQSSTLYLLEKINDQRTRLTIEYYKKKNFLQNAIFNLQEKNKLDTSMKRSMDKLGELIKVIEFPY